MRNHGFRSGCRDSRRSWDGRSLGDPRRSGYGRDGCYRRPGFLTGGFAWLAGWLGLPAWVIVAFFVVLFLTVGWPALVIYLVCALLLRPEPETAGPVTVETTGIRLDEEAHKIHERARDLDARIGRLESHVTSKEFDFDRRLNTPGQNSR